jgi:hypothetical protein
MGELLRLWRYPKCAHLGMDRKQVRVENDYAGTRRRPSSTIASNRSP